MTETPAAEDRESDRLADILPDAEQEQVRPDYLPEDPEDHPLIKAMQADLEQRIQIEPLTAQILADETIASLRPEQAFVLGYQTAIHQARAMINNDGLEVQVIEL